MKPGIKEVVKDFHKDTKIIMPQAHLDHAFKEKKKGSENAQFAAKEKEKEVKAKKTIDEKPKATKSLKVL